MKKSCDLLIFVEDPGALNFLAPLFSAFAAQGWKVVLLCGNPANRLIGQSSRQFSELPDSFHIVENLDADEVWSQWAPRVVLVGTSENVDSLAFSFIELARQASVPSVGAVDASANANARFRGRTQNPLAHAPDWLLVPDAATRQGFLNCGFESSRIIVGGHPYFDFVRAQGRKLDRQNTADKRERVFPTLNLGTRPLWIFGSELSMGLGDIQSAYRKTAAYSLQGRGESVERTRVVLEEWIDAVDWATQQMHLPRPALVVRLHPKDNAENYSAYTSQIDGFSRGGSSLEVVNAADAVFGMSSMLLVEALLMQRPALSILPRQSEFREVLEIARGRIGCVWTRPDLRDAIRKFLHPNGSPMFTEVPATCFGAIERVESWLGNLLWT